MLRVEEHGQPSNRRTSEPIVRDRVLELLQAAADRRIALIVAPAGFGKSVLIKQFLKLEREPYVYYSFRRDNERLCDFLTGIASAISHVSADPKQNTACLCAGTDFSETTASYLGEWLAAQLSDYRGMIVLEDLHRSRSDLRVCQVIATAINLTSSNVRWLISTRDTGALPVASWLAYGLTTSPIDGADLALTESEAAAIAASSEVDFSSEALRDVLAMTQAWPAAFAFALYSSKQATDLDALAAKTRSMAYSFLAEQTLRPLDTTERQFLFDTAFFPALHPALIRLAGYGNPIDSLDKARRATGFVLTGTDGVCRYHNLFQNFLIDRLRSTGAAEYSHACARAAQLLQQAHFLAEALDLFTQAGSGDNVVSLLQSHGLQLLVDGRLNVVEDALRLIRDTKHCEDALILVLDGWLQRMKSHYDEAEVLLHRAMRSATDSTLQIEAAFAYAGLLTYPDQRYSEALAILDTVSQYRISDASLKSRIMARRAFLLSSLGQISDASELINNAKLQTCALAEADRAKRLVLQYAASVELNSGDLETALGTALDLVRQTERAGLPLWSLAAMDIVIQANYDLGRLSDCDMALQDYRRLAESVGSRAHVQQYLTVAFHLAAERGDDPSIARLSEMIEKEKTDTVFRHASLASVYALFAASEGDFSKAYAIATESRYKDSPSHELLRIAKRLVYAAAAGLRIEAEMSLDEFNDALASQVRKTAHPFPTCQAFGFAALGALLINRGAMCKKLLALLEKSTMHGDAVHLGRLVREVYLYTETGCAGEINQATTMLRKSRLGGYARMFQHIIFPRGGSERVLSALTQTELGVLQLLSTGATTQQVAAKLGRSPHTVDSHVKAIARKLQCHGRREAIALAYSRGIL